MYNKYLNTQVDHEKRIGKVKYDITEDGFDDSLGTIGGGNHFAELMMVESGDMDSDRLYLCVHSGSRDYGVHIQSLFPGVKSISINNPMYNDFMKLHNKGIVWAKLNRELIAHKFCKAAGLTLDKKLYELTHNFIEKRDFMHIHRKGSIPANDGPAMIPGSRGTFSYLVESKGDLHSLPHGAGRKLSRNMAKEKLNHYTVKEMIKTDLNSYVVTDSKSILITEHPECYKDIDSIIGLLEQDHGVKVIAKFRPLVTVKY